MPIKFRCAYCNQLLAISRRKAGSVVHCPRCSRDVVVPQTSAEARGPEPQEAAPPGAGSPPLFEQSDFDDLFRPAAAPNAVAGDAFAFTEPVAEPAPPAAAVPPDGPGTQIDAGFDVEPVLPPAAAAETPAPQPGIVLSSRMATCLSVTAILALAVAFVAGLLVGYLFRT
jgi:phage FluMu protein Com